MKRISITIIFILLLSLLASHAAGTHTNERFYDDVTITDAIIPTGEYENAVFVKNLTLINAIVRKEAFKNVIVIGNLTITGCTIANDAFSGMTLVGQQSVDEATVYFDDTQAGGGSGDAVFNTDVVISDPVIADGAYAGAIFYGDLTVNSTVVGKNAFFGAVVMGNLNVTTTYAMESSFNKIVVLGTSLFNAKVVGLSALKNAALNGKVTLVGVSELHYELSSYYDEENDMLVDTKGYDNFSGCRIGNGLELDIPIEIPALAFANAYINGELSYDSSTTTFALNAFSAVTFGNLIVKTTDVSPSLFRGATIEKRLSFSQGVKTIGAESFLGVKIGTLDIFPSSLTEIGNEAFNKCGISDTITLPSSGATIGTWAFANNQITTVVIPQNIKSIPTALFADCHRLKTMVCETGCQLRSIGAKAFTRCGFTEIVLPKFVTEIGEEAFYLVPADKIILPEKIDFVGTNAFERVAQKEGGALPSVSREILIPERAYLQLTMKYKNIDLSYTGICTFDKLFIWASDKAVLPKITNNDSYYASWWREYYDYESRSTLREYMLNEAWDLSEQWVLDYLSQGYVYVPKGTKDILLAALAKGSSISPSLPLIPESHWIEIEMLDYPNYIMTLAGDINGDGSIDGNDVSILLEMVLAGGVTDEQKDVADVNGDGSVDGNDVSILLEMVLAGE